jgi:hypothetical protein
VPDAIQRLSSEISAEDVSTFTPRTCALFGLNLGFRIRNARLSLAAIKRRSIVTSAESITLSPSTSPNPAQPLTPHFAQSHGGAGLHLGHSFMRLHSPSSGKHSLQPTCRIHRKAQGTRKAICRIHHMAAGCSRRSSHICHHPGNTLHNHIRRNRNDTRRGIFRKFRITITPKNCARYLSRMFEKCCRRSPRL